MYNLLITILKDYQLKNIHISKLEAHMPSILGIFFILGAWLQIPTAKRTVKVTEGFKYQASDS